MLHAVLLFVSPNSSVKSCCRSSLSAAVMQAIKGGRLGWEVTHDTEGTATS